MAFLLVSYVCTVETNDTLFYREEAFNKKLWERNATHIIENIYLPAAQAENAG